MALSEKQRTEFHLSLAAYLQDAGFQEAAAALSKEAQLDTTVLEEKHHGLLEKKWTSVTRLQKKVMELEAKLEEAHKETRAPRGRRDNSNPASWMPASPCRYPINAVSCAFDLLIAVAE